MKLIKMFVLIIVLLAMVFFLMRNDDRATVNLLYQQFTDITVAVIMLVSFGVGLIIGFLMAIASILSAKHAARVLRSKNKKLVEELNRLRNVNIDEEALSADNMQEV
ncbi:DUF1049 domain-containing protein [bacterium]|nr:DUF1049 domain-containing protein [bacterium]